MSYTVKIKSIGKITHDVLQIQTEKPDGLVFTPGQAADITIDKIGMENEKRPFTFTSLPGYDHLEFTIKTYPERKGVTNELLYMSVGEALVIHDVFGDIAYRGEGTFIAGGAGVTPFISIFRELEMDHRVGANRLFFANKTAADIIHRQYFQSLLGECFINVLSKENQEEYETGYITQHFIEVNADLLGYFYICGPPPMMESVITALRALGIPDDRIVQESM
jgi:ferredoxin-NADP reductase